MHAEKARERVRFSVTELWKFPSGMLDRAVTLTQLYAGERTCAVGFADRTCRRSKAVARERGDERLDPSGSVSARGSQLTGIPGLESTDARLGESPHRLGAGLGRQEPQGLGREVVVVGLECLVADLTEDVGPRGTTATPSARGRGGLALLDEAGLDQVVEVASHGGDGQVQIVGHRRGGHRAVLADGLEDPVACARLENHRHRSTSRDIHNTNVT